jgi:hypothetical protein
MPTNPEIKLTIIGGGIIGAIEAYFAYLDAKQQNKNIRITILEKNSALSDTTACNLAPSLTPREIFALPRGEELLEKMGISFSEFGGTLVTDVPEVNDSLTTQNFKAAVLAHSKDEQGILQRRQTLLAMGKASMALWQKIYATADAELQQIMQAANFNPCFESEKFNNTLHNGYRICLYKLPNAAATAQSYVAANAEMGYVHSKVLTPAEVVALDPFLQDFCLANSKANSAEKLEWHEGVAAILIPGGCLDTEIFLPQFYAYLHRVMGQYVNAAGVTKDCFRLKLQRKVHGVIYEAASDDLLLAGLQVNSLAKFNKHSYDISNYVFCPGENVGTLASLGFDEPAFAGFAGASLKLNIPVAADQVANFAALNNTMSVAFTQAGFAWQARFRNGKIYIGVGGCKAYYGTQKPQADEEFATNKHLEQLRVINQILPQCVSLALGRNTAGQELTALDLAYLEQQGIAQRWVGRRALAYDGFPTLGYAYKSGKPVINARFTTQLGSGGVSFGPAAVVFSRAASKDAEANVDPLINDALKFGAAYRMN